MSKEFSEELVIACNLWLGNDGIDFFQTCLMHFGTVSPIFIYKLDSNRNFPHSVHFREGMMVRNWMRTQGETSGWTAHDYDDNWTNLIEKAILY